MDIISISDDAVQVLIEDEFVDLFHHEHKAGYGNDEAIQRWAECFTRTDLKMLFIRRWNTIYGVSNLAEAYRIHERIANENEELHPAPAKFLANHYYWVFLAMEKAVDLCGYSFRRLDEKGVEDMLKWVDENYKQGEEVNSMWHPVVRKEWYRRNWNHYVATRDTRGAK